MPKAEYQRLTWEDATERFLDVTEISRKERTKPLEAAFDTFAYSTHNALTGAAERCIGTARSSMIRQGQAWLAYSGLRSDVCSCFCTRLCTQGRQMSS